MRYRITHTTTYLYKDLVPLCMNEAYLIPRSAGRQICHHHKILIQPKTSRRFEREDYFQNRLLQFSIHKAHRRLDVTAMSEVTVLYPTIPWWAETPAWETLRSNGDGSLDRLYFDAVQFRFDSPAVTRSPELADFAAQDFAPGQPVVQAVADLNARIHREFQYDPGATNVKTRVEDVLQLRRGVCQDFAHLMIGCLRSLGIPARYVSGYLRTAPVDGGADLIGNVASHAWVAVWCGPETGWVEVDPTNNVFGGLDHIVLAWGRDYFDVSPIKGILIGGGDQDVQVSVDVTPV